jgi:hypothetical protein
MIDVACGKPFKDQMCHQWATWMLEECEKQGLTPAQNYRRPSQITCCQWVKAAWASVPTTTESWLKKAIALGMGPEPGPEIVGYEDGHEFEDVEPAGEDEIIRDAGLDEDIRNAEEPEPAIIPISGKNKKIKKKK